MLIQFANIVAGILLCSSFINEKLSHQSLSQALRSINLYAAEIGIATLVLGILALIERLGAVHFGLPLGSSYPQAIPAIVAGLVLGYPLVRTYAPIEETVRRLEPYREIIGVIAILAGLGSLLFGCISPVGCPGGMM